MLIPENKNPLLAPYRNTTSGWFSGAFKLRDRVSYYQSSANNYKPFPTLRGHMKCDVVIVGGGYTGLSAALELAEKNVDVVLIEQMKVGYGASGRNGGQLIKGWHWEQKDFEETFGKTVSDMTWQVALDSVELVKQRIKKYNIKCDLKMGWDYVAITKRQDNYLKANCEFLDKKGYHIEYISREKLHKKLLSPRYISGGQDMRSGHLHPLNLAIGYAEAARNAGAKIFEFSPAIHIDTDRAFVKTPAGSIEADTLILAGGAWLNWKKPIVKELYKKVMPIGSYIIATEPLQDKQLPILDDHAYCDMNWVLDYFRLSNDKRLLFGGRATYTAMEPKSVIEWMRPRMLKVFPHLKDIKIDFGWGGLIDITQNRLLHMGELPAKDKTINRGKRTLFVQGFAGQGVNMAGYAGKILAETAMAMKIGKQQKQFELIRKFKQNNFPGGIIRTPLLVLAMTYFRLKDML